MNRRASSAVAIGATVAFLVFLAGWVAATVAQDAQRPLVRTVTVTVTPEPTVEPSPSVRPTPAPVVRYIPPPKPKPAKDEGDGDDDSDGDSDEGTNIKHESEKFNKDADGYKPKKGCDSECQFEIADYGDD